MSTFRMGGMERKSAFTTSLSPGLRLITRSGRSARSVRRVRKALNSCAPARKEDASDTITITKSNTFHPDRRYAFSCSANPCTMILSTISTVNSVVATTSSTVSTPDIVESGSFRGLSMASVTEDTKMTTITVDSNHLDCTTVDSHCRKRLSGGSRYSALPCSLLTVTRDDRAGLLARFRRLPASMSTTALACAGSIADDRRRSLAVIGRSMSPPPHPPGSPSPAASFSSAA
mmetsp:Transcript_27437/g.88180  ORF Transcript_27437/g.88180 Transcript_27437/m.88180 type:complete len:232 (+) Transcript_27437:2225-2920(+)